MFNRSLSRLSDWAFHGLLRAQTRLQVLAVKARDERGAITIEYILIIALIAFIIIALFTALLWPALEPAFEALLQKITDAIGGEGIN